MIHEPELCQRPQNFYIGYEERMPPSLAFRLRLFSCLLLLVCLMLGVGFVMGQSPFPAAHFEHNRARPFQGIIRLDPYPRLLIRRPGLSGKNSKYSSYLLTSPLKFGAEKMTKEFRDKYVVLEGRLLYRKEQTMLEVVPNSIKRSKGATHSPLAHKIGQKTLTLQGEIIDSKCWTGAMKPGRGKLHRACAIMCIRGGIPPIFVPYFGEDKDVLTSFLLVSSEGKTVNKEVIPFLAKPIQITGTVIEEEGHLILRAEPKDYILLDHIPKKRIPKDHIFER